MSNNKRTHTKKFISRSITILCLGVFLYAAYGLIDIVMAYYQNRQVLSETQDMFYSGDSIDGKAQNNDTGGSSEIRPEFNELLESNADVAGWITVEGTKIDYPILQATDNVTYLDRNFYKDDSIAGSIFLDYRNDFSTLDLNTIIYGHRMKDGTMFQHLTKFEDEEFFDEHRIVGLETLYDSYEAEIFSVYLTTTDFDYIQTDFSSKEDYANLLTDIKEKSMFDSTIEVNKNDQIITLSTCDYTLDPDEGRLVVHAKLIEKD